MSIWIPGGYKEPEPPYVPCEWSTGTDAEIVEALEKHYAGNCDLTQYWSVGDERTVSTSTSTTYPSIVAQTIKLVILHCGGKYLSDGVTECAFIVGFKNCLYNSNNNALTWAMSLNTNKISWDSAYSLRGLLNNYLIEIFPSTISSIFKQFINVTTDAARTGTVSTTDLFAVPANREVFGAIGYGVGNQYSPGPEANLIQFDYYKTSANRIKYIGEGSSTACDWWERTPTNTYYGNYHFCTAKSDGTNYYAAQNTYLSFSPFGVI